MTHKLTRTLIFVACSAAISLSPLAADDLGNYLSSIGGGAYDSNGSSFTDGNLSITFTFYSDTVTCFDPVHGAVACPSGVASPTGPDALSLFQSTVVSAPGLPSLDGFTLQGTVQAQSELDSYGNLESTTEDITLEYTVTDNSGSISDLHLGVGGASLTGATSDPPEFTVGESTDAPGAGSISVTDPPPSFTDQINLPTPVSTLTVAKDISLISGSGLGDQASFSILTQSFSQVPEPRAYAAVLGLFFALFFVIKRRRQQTA